MHATLSKRPTARVLLLERGPYCKTDVLTERNPLTLLRDATRVVARYEHGVMQGSTLGGMWSTYLTFSTRQVAETTMTYHGKGSSLF